jgi:hypothetical protein
LRLLAEKAEAAALCGGGSGDAAIRAANVATRASRDLMLTTKGSKSSDGSNALADYLAARAQEADAEFEAVETDVEVDLEFNKRHPFESAPASAHVAPDPDFAPAEPIEADAHDAGGAP